MPGIFLPPSSCCFHGRTRAEGVATRMHVVGQLTATDLTRNTTGRQLGPEYARLCLGRTRAYCAYSKVHQLI